MNKRRIRARTLSLEVFRIMRGQELGRQSGRIIQIPDYVIKGLEKSQRQIEAGLTKPFRSIEDLLGIIRYGKRGIAYRKFRRNRRKALRKRNRGNR